jgi:hypothetical protein
MAYIGRSTDKISNIEVLDNITFDGSSSYTLQKGGSNFTPSSANTLLVSIDGVVQAGNFTVSGSTIDFGVAIPSTSTCDFILHYGTGLITTPADGTVTTAKIGSGAVTSAKLASDVTQGITEADQWRLTADATSNQEPISANLERVDTNGFGYIGTGMTESSGIFTFPSTGVWRVEFNARYSKNGETRYVFTEIAITTNNSTYATASRGVSFIKQAESTFTVTGGYTFLIFNVTDTSTHKVRFDVISSQSVSINGDTNENDTYMTFTRLGD